jgi:hypothetical protein
MSECTDKIHVYLLQNRTMQKKTPSLALFACKTSLHTEYLCVKLVVGCQKSARGYALKLTVIHPSNIHY